MSQTYRNILNITLGILMAGVLGFAYIHGKTARNEILCKRVTITISDSTENRFVTKETILGHLDSRYNDYIGKPISTIDLGRMEAILDSMSVIKKSQVYTRKDSVIYIEVVQRKPVARFQNGSEGFYTDEEGFIIPLQGSTVVNVPIIDGYLRTEEEGWIQKMVDLVVYMESSRTWRGRIAQIYVDAKGNVTLIPRSGNEQFMIGEPTDIRDKFKKMEIYYTGILKDKGEGYYSTVDVRYDKQIVCRQDQKKNKK